MNQQHMTFPASRVERFFKEYWPAVRAQQRAGQAFFNYLVLHKCAPAYSPSTRWFFDKMYEIETAQELRAYIAPYVDTEN